MGTSYHKQFTTHPELCLYELSRELLRKIGYGNIGISTQGHCLQKAVTLSCIFRLLFAVIALRAGIFMSFLLHVTTVT